MIKEHRGEVQTHQYTYDVTNHMTLGRNLENGTQTEYAYNALYMRIKNIQTIAGEDGFRTREVSYLPDFLSRTDNELMAYEKGKYSLRTVFGRGYERLAGTAAVEAEAAGAELPGVEAVEKMYFQPDFYGSPLFALNGQGQVLRYAERGVWGDLKQPADSGLNETGLEESLRFTSYGFDSVIGKHFARARFYDSGQGRMLAADPVKRGLNGYSYCDSDPVNYTDPTGEIPSIVIGGGIGALVGGTFGFGGSALSQILSGEDFSFRKALGAAANGAIVGGVRGALIGSGVGAGAALAADFGAGTLGSAAEQLIGTGRASVKESLKDGLINAVTGRIYGNDKIRSLGEALGRGAAAGGVTSGINYLSDAFTPRPGRLGGNTLNGLAGMMLMGAGSAFGRDPRRGCGTGSRDVDWIGERMAYGYQYGVSQTAQKKGGFSFDLADFGKEIFVGAVTGGLASAAFYGAGKAVQALAGSINNKSVPAAEELTISSRNSSRGNPNAINHFGEDLNTRQRNLLNKLPNYDSSTIVSKSDVNLNDLSALTAKTGDEFAMFTRGSQRMIVRGGPTNVNINGIKAQELASIGYRWSGHTHPGIGTNVRLASEGDLFILSSFKQTRSAIYDSGSNFDIFGG